MKKRNVRRSFIAIQFLTDLLQARITCEGVSSDLPDDAIVIGVYQTGEQYATGVFTAIIESAAFIPPVKEGDEIPLIDIVLTKQQASAAN